MRKTRVAVTGLGAVTPVGNDAESTWASLVAGRSGVGPLTTFEADTYPVRIAGLVKNFDVAAYLPDPRLARYLSRSGGFCVGAAVQAVRDAVVAPDAYAPFERGISVGGSMGRPELQELSDIVLTLDRTEGHELLPQRPGSVVLRDQNVTTSILAELIDCQGPVLSLSTACAGSAHAIGEAFRRIQEGDARMMIAGGHDALTSWLDVLGFALLGALAVGFEDNPQAASRPFHRDRSGFVLGEGAVIVVLEDWDTAVARGANIRAELLGFGSSLNAYRMTDPPPDGPTGGLAMAMALEDSGLRPDQINYVVAHGTGTPGNDKSETAALKHVFGADAYRLAVSSPKSMTGHLTNAAGALNLLAAVGAVRDQVVPPTINLTVADPALDLDYVPNVARQVQVKASLVNAFAFGGTNASLVICSPDFVGGD